ncbi:MAG: putative metal-dependent hydrolase [Halioglobus sp.]|jgi:predicted metal-dependent hydrolase
MTTAPEHITAIMAEQILLEGNHLLAGAERLMRKASLRRASFFLMMDVLVGTIHMLRRDGKLWCLRL